MSLRSFPPGRRRRWTGKARSTASAGTACLEWGRWRCLALLLPLGVAACASHGPSGYGVAADPAGAPRAFAQDAPHALDDAPPATARDTYLALIRKIQQQDLWHASLAHIDAAEQQYGPSPELTLLRAQALRQTGQPQASAQSYQALLDTPLQAAGQHGLGLLAAARGDYPQAITLFGQALRHTPVDAPLLSDLGYAELHTRQMQAARLHLLRATQLQPDSARAASNLAVYWLVAGDGEQARVLMDERRFPPALREAVTREAERLRAAPPPSGEAP